MANEWAGVVTATAQKYTKGFSDQTIRDRFILKALKNRGRVKFGETGYDFNWQMKYKEPAVESVGSTATLDFSQGDFYKRATVDLRGYAATDALAEKNKLMNSGDLALINYYKQKIPDLIASITQKMDDEFFIDGNAAGNENRLHGIESFCGTGTTVVGDKIARPADTYAGLSTIPGNYGGSWSAALTTKPNADLATDWPDGSGSTEYDFNSPRIMNWSSTAWTGTGTFVSTAERCLRQATIWTTLTTGKEGKPDVYLLAGNLYYDYLNLQGAKQQIFIPYKEGQDLGFGASPQQEGVGIMEAYGVPTNTGYGLNFDKMKLCCMYPTLFKTEGPEYEMRSGSYLFAVRFFGNLIFESPKHFVKLKNVAA